MFVHGSTVHRAAQIESASLKAVFFNDPRWRGCVRSTKQPLETLKVRDKTLETSPRVGTGGPEGSEV